MDIIEYIIAAAIFLFACAANGNLEANSIRMIKENAITIQKYERQIVWSVQEFMDANCSSMNTLPSDIQIVDCIYNSQTTNKSKLILIAP